MKTVTRQTRNSKLRSLSIIEGYGTITEMLENASSGSVVPGICSEECCDYSIPVEPDCAEGWCPACQSNSVQSCLVLAGII